MTKHMVRLTQLSAVLLLLSFSSNSFASGYHGGGGAYKYIPIGIAIGYLAHKSYSHKVHHRGRGYGHSNRYYGNRYSGRRSYGNRYYGNRYYGKRSYGYNNRYYGGKRYSNYRRHY